MDEQFFQDRAAILKELLDRNISFEMPAAEDDKTIRDKYRGGGYFRELVRRRDGHRCQLCPAKQKGRGFHVHHLGGLCGRMKAGDDLRFGIEITRLMVTLCPRCHRNIETVRLKQMASMKSSTRY